MNRLAKGLFIFAGALLLAALAYRFAIPYMLDPVNAFRYRPERTPWPTINRARRTPEPTTEPTPEPTPAPAVAFNDDNSVNILLLGYDMSEERARAGLNARTDFMMLAHIDFDDKQVTLISLPRDSRVRIEGGSRVGKINAAFSYAGGTEGTGFQAALNTVEWVLGGIPVDYYAAVDMNAAKRVVDALGGVDYEVDIEFTMNGRRLEKGFQHLSGQQVLDYCRFRKSGRGDLDRVERQQRILMALFNQILSKETIPQIPELYESMKEAVSTNLSVRQIASLCWFGMDLSGGDISARTLPGRSSTINDTSYFIINQAEKRDMALEVFGVDIGTGESFAAPSEVEGRLIDTSAADRLNEQIDAAFDIMNDDGLSAVQRATLNELINKAENALSTSDMGACDFIAAQINAVLTE